MIYMFYNSFFRCQEYSARNNEDLESEGCMVGEMYFPGGIDSTTKYIRIRTEPLVKEEFNKEINGSVKYIKIGAEEDFKPKVDYLTIKPLFLCQKCELTFTSDESFVKHLKVHEFDSPSSLLTTKIEIFDNEKCPNFVCEKEKDTYGMNAANNGLIDCERELNFNIIMPNMVVPTFNFQCPVCAMSFSERSKWLTHNKRHPLDLQCEQCEHLFCHEKYLMFHKLEEHSNFKVCNYCWLAFETEDLFNKHLYKHIICDHCGQSFKSIVALKSHRRIHLQAKQFQCNKCSKSFLSKNGLYNHQQQLHSSSTVGYKCGLCDMLFQNENLLKYHILNHDTAKTLVCEICYKAFNRTCNLNAHLATHISDIFCKVCCCSFISQFRLESHLSMHTDSEIAECEITPKSIECPFEDCEMTFLSRLQLYEHKKTHLDIIEFPCIDCYRKFKTESQLATHRKTHHQIDTDCRTCGKHFSTLKTLREHIRMHTGEKPFVCGVCSVEFRCQSSLVAHRAIHSTERRYMCGICKRTFARASYLKEHLRTHRKERPFKCTLCTKSFTQSNVLKTHMNLRHQSCWVCKQTIGNTTQMRVHLLKEHNMKLDYKPTDKSNYLRRLT